VLHGQIAVRVGRRGAGGRGSISNDSPSGDTSASRVRRMTGHGRGADFDVEAWGEASPMGQREKKNLVMRRHYPQTIAIGSTMLCPSISVRFELSEIAQNCCR